MKIAITVLGGADNPTIWSGTPYGIMQALKELGHDVHSVNVVPHPRIGSAYIRLLRATHPRLRGKSAAYIRESLAFSKILTLNAKTALKKIAPDLTIQIGTGYGMGTHPFVTFEDMTIPQAVKFHWGDTWNELSSQEVSLRKSLQQQQYEGARAVCMATDWAASSATNDYAVLSHKVHAVGLGINKNIPGVTADKDFSHPKFLFVGNDWERKNGARVVAAFSRLRGEYAQATLDIVGNTPLIQGEGITVHGKLSLANPAQQEKLEELYRASTVLVVPSLLEPAGIIYAEAAAYGVPSIGTAVGGASYMIGDGGQVVNPESQQEIFEAMKRMCDPALAQSLGQKALIHAQEFTWVKVAQKILDTAQ